MSNCFGTQKEIDRKRKKIEKDTEIKGERKERLKEEKIEREIERDEEGVEEIIAKETLTRAHTESTTILVVGEFN